ncbi:DUF3883 domain-containing protein [uncultured Treponema sp.]|uniref:protein NO VEIN domain-containing protein n=1 Tax=uncultured Treponema sp. TaxID=162155 RepID=UPI0025962148|nr:DUF3883 domain-containing protein [uncultured Treponema sp.]
MYKIPDEYFYRLHHVRPRFKGDIENVLFYVAHICSELKELPVKEYAEKMNQAIYLFPGNSGSVEKTINNWRTEIAALFGFYIEDKKSGNTKTGETAYFLDKTQDLVQFFKFYLFKFQYPGGHLKSNEIKNMIDAGIRFKPAQYILKMMNSYEIENERPLSITKEEATHCIFNDLRVTRDNRNVLESAGIILKNRKHKIEYEHGGDINRYAGDILDYMVQANLLHESHGYYSINHTEMEAIMVFINDDELFHGYDEFYRKTFSPSDISALEDDWFEYVNSNLAEDLFKTDLSSYFIDKSKDSEKSDFEIAVDSKIEEILNDVGSTKDIGDLGEALVIGHEKLRLKNLGREDLIHLIKKIPTQLAVGYDIQSVEENQLKRFIEVKTSISYKPLKFFSFHLTRNEWDSATTLKDRYFVYRLMINKTNKMIYILQDPVQLYKNDKIAMRITDGADISFSEDVSEKTELLIWEN